MDLFEHRERYPNHPGYQATDTSRAAAVGMAGRAAYLQTVVLGAIRSAGAQGMTIEEVAEATGHGRHSVQPRTSELREMGKIKDSGLRRPLASGRNGICWVVA